MKALWKTIVDDGIPAFFTDRTVLRILGGLGLLVVFVLLGSYVWRGRLPLDYHPTDGDWLPPGSENTRSADLLRRPDEGDYRSPFFLEEPPRKVLLITIDTLRADHLSSYGYPKETSPFLDSLADSGIKFTSTYAPMSKTLPAHTSLMTGLYPLQHNVKTNHRKAHGDLRTLAETLSEKGYTTAGFVSTNRHFTPGNLDQGFETFASPSDEEQYFDPPWVDGDTRFNLYYRSAEKTLNEAREWIQARPSREKQFIWIHLFDPHFPYAYRPEFHDPIRYEDSEERGDWIEFVREQRGVDLRRPGRKDPGENPFLSTYRLYDGEIRYVDRQLESFYESINRTWEKGPLSIITSDHGEGMGNHDWWGHSKYIYNEQIRVPLIVHHPEKSWDRTVTTVTELNDLYATINREARVSYAESMDRVPVPLSHPLQRLQSDTGAPGFGRAFGSRTTFSETLLDPAGWIRWRWRQLMKNDRQYPLNPGKRWDGMTWPGRQFVLLDGDYSYVHNTALRDEFYDQRTDFYQTRNLISQPGSEWRQYGRSLSEVLRTLEHRRAPESGSVDEETKQELKGLGYVN